MSQAAVQRPPARFDASVVTGAKPAPFPGFVEPCHPTLREEAPAGARWVHEIKFDGYRTQAHLQNGRPAIYTRHLQRAARMSAWGHEANLAETPHVSAFCHSADENAGE
jgi:ATP-dependent DNA ligase